MPRPKKCRRICALPTFRAFGPCTRQGDVEIVYMTVDEFETIRLIDFMGLTQEDCALQMGVARTTVQAVYVQARQQLADMLVNGKQLAIDGGQYAICPCAGNCDRQCCTQQGCTPSCKGSQKCKQPE